MPPGPITCVSISQRRRLEFLKDEEYTTSSVGRCEQAKVKGGISAGRGSA
jgi:hypothetical protein